jgi:L-lactate utilization protein LutB
MKSKKSIPIILMSKLVNNFKLRNIEVSYFDTIQDATNMILRLIPTECTVGIGHSLTLQKMNITNLLIERGNVVFDKELATSKEECKILKKKALLTDWYISGSNAISVDGRIINVDHSGNRVAAITFGPENVIIVVGKNKIVNSLEKGIHRVKNIAYPLNAKRAGFNPPCVLLNRCVDCTSEERVCNSLSIIEGQSDKNRMKLFIIDEELGY